MCQEFARSLDQRCKLARMKVPNIEGGQKVEERYHKAPFIITS